MIAYKGFKNNGKLLNPKVVAVTYRTWSFSRGSNYRALTEKVLVVWMVG